MRRVLFSLVVAGVVFALAYGAAASLNVNGGVVQAGSDDNADQSFQCDTDGVNVSYTTTWDSTQNQYIVNQVRVDNISAACDTYLVKVALLEGTTPMGLTTGHANDGGCSGGQCSTGWMTIPTTNKPRAALLTSVKVSIYKP